MATYYKGRKYYDFPPLEWFDEHNNESYIKEDEMNKDTHFLDYPWIRCVLCDYMVTTEDGKKVPHKEIVVDPSDKEYMKKDDETVWTLPNGEKTHQITIYISTREFPSITTYKSAFRTGMKALRLTEQFYKEVNEANIYSMLVNMEMG